MAVISAGKGSHSAEGSIKYVQYEKKSKQSRILFSKGIECSSYYKDAIHDFQCVRDTYQKHGGREAHHMVLAFSPEEEQRFTNKDLFAKAVEVARCTFPNHQVWLGMHNDTSHLHVHMIINSVNIENGKKMQIAGRKGMYKIMETVQHKCSELGLDDSLTIGMHSKENGRVSTHNIIEYKLIEQGKSWKLDMAQNIHEALNESSSRINFILNCSERGIYCKWVDNHKHVTFSYIDDPSKKVRNSTLAKTFTLDALSTKETMQHIFKINKDRGEQASQLHPKEYNRVVKSKKNITIKQNQSKGYGR